MGGLACPEHHHPRGRGDTVMKTQRERAEERRNLRLEDVERQVESGSLVIRPMTDEERERFPPLDPDQQPRKRRWS